MLDIKKLSVLQACLINQFEREFRKEPAFKIVNGIKKVNVVEDMEILKRKLGAIDAFLSGDKKLDIMFAQAGTKVKAAKQRESKYMTMHGSVSGIDYLNEGQIYTISGVYTADWYYVIQLDEFPGLVFDADSFAEAYTESVTEHNFAEMYGDEFDNDMNAVQKMCSSKIKRN